MFNSPYDTKVAVWQKIKDIQAAMRTAKIEDRLIPASTELNVSDRIGASAPPKGTPMWYLVSGITGNDAEPVFNHPIIFTDTLGKQNIVIDLRLALSADPATRELTIRNRSAMLDMQQAIVRMKAVWYWASGNRRDFLNFNPVGMQVFARWLTEGPARNLNMNYDTVPRLMAYSAWFYYCQFFDEAEVEVAVGVKKIHEQSRINQLVVADVLKDVPYVGDITTFVKYAPQVVGSDELSMLTTKLLVASIGSGWIGANAAEASGIGIEYPPYFLSMLYGSTSNRLYRNSALGRILDRNEFRKSKEDFARIFTSTINE